MDDTTKPPKAPAAWIDALAKSEAQLAAGQTVPAATIRQRLRDSVARLEAKQAAAPERTATRRR